MTAGDVSAGIAEFVIWAEAILAVADDGAGGETGAGGAETGGVGVTVGGLGNISFGGDAALCGGGGGALEVEIVVLYGSIGEGTGSDGAG